LTVASFLISDFATRKRVPGISESGSILTEVTEVIDLKQSKPREDACPLTCDTGPQSFYSGFPRTFVRDRRIPHSEIV
jgi:hypothetical protein